MQLLYRLSGRVPELLLFSAPPTFLVLLPRASFFPGFVFLDSPLLLLDLVLIVGCIRSFVIAAKSNVLTTLAFGDVNKQWVKKIEKDLTYIGVYYFGGKP